MSNIPTARRHLEHALYSLESGDTEGVKVFVTLALDKMTRVPAVRKARAQHAEITAETKARIRELAKDNTKTLHEIAIAAGVRNSGRVSEVLNGLR